MTQGPHALNSMMHRHCVESSARQSLFLTLLSTKHNTSTVDNITLG